MPKVFALLILPILPFFLPVNRYHRPNGLIAIDASNNLKLYPFNLNTKTFYGNHGGSILRSNFDYLDYYVADWTGDGYTDILIKDPGTNLYLATINSGQFHLSRPVGSGFISPRYFSGKWGNRMNAPEIVGIDDSGNTTGYMLQFDSDGNAQVSNEAAFNPGNLEAGIYTHYFVSDWTNDGFTDVICRTPDGEMYFYKYDPSSSRFLERQRVGHGWNFVTYHIGDWDQNGSSDFLMVTDQNGALKLMNFWNGTFYGKAGGEWAASGFDQFTELFVGDWSGDKVPEILSLDAAGVLRLHEFPGATQKQPSLSTTVTQVGHGFASASFKKVIAGTW